MMNKMNNNDPFYLGAYWGDRKENIDTCAHRLAKFLKQLGELDEIFKGWSTGGRSLKEALANKSNINEVMLRELLDKEGRLRTDIGSEVMNDLGFSVGFWNRRRNSEGSVGLSVHCGSYAGHFGILNNCVIELPDDQKTVQRVIRTEMLEKVLCAVAECWEPEWAVVTTHGLLESFKKSPQGAPDPGWLIFICKRRGNVCELPEPSRKKVLDDLGTIVVVTDERFDTKRKEHIKAVKKVYRVLKKANLLEPIPQCAENVVGNKTFIAKRCRKSNGKL